VVARLDSDRAAIIEAARSARVFAQRHAFEAAFVQRVAHIIRNSRLPEALRTESLARIAPANSKT